MHLSTEGIYSAARQEVDSLHALLQEQADLFNQTFALSAEEVEQLNAHAELHASGSAIELSMQDMDIVFSLGTVFDCQTGSDAWELVAFHGPSAEAHWVSTMWVGPTASEHGRRMHGVRLVAVIGDYLDREQRGRQRDEWQEVDTRGHVIDFMRMESHITWQPQVAAHSVLQPA